ncbi:MAG TPA: response regulator [Bryobacteraceae bacterium]|nr:response regulator [Bryobacteraceae bacterium]
MDKLQTKRILVVDDEECIAETLVLILQSFGYNATARNSARSALEECELQPPDLVISDVIMPEMNGIELAIEIERQYADSRILLISGLGSSFALLDEAAQKGHRFEIMPKPIRPNDLLAKIKRVLAGDVITRSPKACVSPGVVQAPESRSDI